MGKGRVYPKPGDDRDYRREEMHSDLNDICEYVRNFRFKHVTRYAIDTAIALQEKRSVLTACNFIRYFMLNELNWIDVFGRNAIEYDKALEHYRQSVAMEIKIDRLQDTINDMSDQMEQMQKMIVNMAMMLNDRKFNVIKSA